VWLWGVSEGQYFLNDLVLCLVMFGDGRGPSTF